MVECASDAQEAAPHTPPVAQPRPRKSHEPPTTAAGEIRARGHVVRATPVTSSPVEARIWVDQSSGDEVTEHVDALSLPPLPSFPAPARKGSRHKVAALGVILVASMAAAAAWYLVRGSEPNREVAAAPHEDQPASRPAAAPVPAVAQEPAVAPSPAPPPVAQPSLIKLRFTSSPPGAEVRIVGELEPLGATPFTATFPRAEGATRTFEFRKDGYTEVREEISLDSDGTFAAALSEVPRPVAARPQAPRPGNQPKPTSAKRPAKRPAKAPSQLDRGGTMDVFANP